MKKPELKEKAQEVFLELKKEFICTYDEAGAIGRRYLRAAEAGTAYCVTVDYETLEKKENPKETVTIRDRDSEEQKRVNIDVLKETLKTLISGDKKFSELK